MTEIETIILSDAENEHLIQRSVVIGEKIEKCDEIAKTARKRKKTTSTRVRKPRVNKKMKVDELQQLQRINVHKTGFELGSTAEKIVGITDCGGGIKFLVKWISNGDMELVPNESCRKHCPELVIEFYEKHIQWERT